MYSIERINSLCTYVVIMRWLLYETFVLSCIELFFPFINVGMESLLDPVIDSSHRSFFTAVEHRALQVLRPHPPAEIVSIHPDWVDRYVLKYYSSFHFFTPISILTFLFFGKIF